MKIERIAANKESFREFELQAGFNLVLADRTKESTRTDSRNGLGKSTLIEILHFLLGSNLGKEQNLYPLRGADWEFTAWFDFDGNKFYATRSLDDTSKLRLGGDTHRLTNLDIDHQAGGIVRLNAWKQFLGRETFGISELDLGKESYKPSFRSLISYFIRSGRGAYLSPFEVRSKQLKWQTQVYNAYLLRLNWRLATEWQRVRDAERTLKAVGRNAQEGIDRFVGQVGELESERVRLRARLRDLQTQAADFRVVPEYRQVEDRVNEITFEMQRLAPENTFESRLVQRYESEVSAEESALRGLNLERLFEEAGVALPGATVRSLGEVAQFHEKVTQNRKSYLAAEAVRLRRRIVERRDRIDALETERQSSLSLLESGGALEDFTRIQMRVAEISAELEAVDRRVDEAQKLRADRAQ